MACTGLRAVAVLLMAAVCFPGDGSAAEGDSPQVLLDPIELTESKNTINHITQVDIERKTAKNLWEALSGVAGVYQAVSGGRGESFVQIRGANRYQIGLFVDDVPVATTYRGEYDFNRIMTFDLESVEVSKGYNSPLLGSNNLGGVINLRTAKPKKKFEASFKYTNFFDRDVEDQGRLIGLSLGSLQEKFYLKGSVMQDEQDFFTLSEDFSPGRDENGGKRENSYYRDRRVNLMAGWTPTEAVDIQFGYSKQDSKKDQPFDASAAGYNRYWKWPDYNSERVYLKGTADLTDKFQISGVAYYDWHKDKMYDYANPEMTRLNTSGSGTYDDYASGGRMEAAYSFTDSNRLALSGAYRLISHKGYDMNGNTRVETLGDHFKEAYWDFGAEYAWKPLNRLTFMFGGAYTWVESKLNEYKNVSVGSLDRGELGRNLWNGQVGAFYEFVDKHELFATFATKSRMPTLRERYTTTDLPNPGLDPEHALHYELGYRGVYNDWLKVTSSVYYSDISDMIAQTGSRADRNRQFVNINEAQTYGWEFSTEALINEYVSGGFTYSWMQWKTIDGPEKLQNLPENMATLFAVITPLQGLSITAQLNYMDKFYDDSAGHKQSAFVTADLKMGYEISENFAIEAGARNIFDKNYEYSFCYPEPGRNFFAGITAKF